MGIFTRLTVQGIRRAGEGSYFGKCDICTLPVSETFVGRSYPVYKKDAQDVYYLGGAFGGEKETGGGREVFLPDV